jgi:hypothetical protein
MRTLGELVLFFVLVHAGLFFGGRAMLRSMRRKGQHRRACHGRSVWVWMMFGAWVGTVLAIPFGKDAPHALMMFGLLCGWAVGTLHGVAALIDFGVHALRHPPTRTPIDSHPLPLSTPAPPP